MCGLASTWRQGTPGPRSSKPAQPRPVLPQISTRGRLAPDPDRQEETEREYQEGWGNGFRDSGGLANPVSVGLHQHPAPEVAEASPVALGEGVDADHLPAVGGWHQGGTSGIARANDGLDVVAETTSGLAGGGGVIEVVAEDLGDTPSRAFLAQFSPRPPLRCLHPRNAPRPFPGTKSGP